VQHRIRRAVRVVLDVVGFAAFEPVRRVKARDLQYAAEPQLLHEPVGEEQRIVVVDEVREPRGKISSVVSIRCGSAASSARSSVSRSASASSSVVASLIA
jgi:hypothetical protein